MKVLESKAMINAGRPFLLSLEIHYGSHERGKTQYISITSLVLLEITTKATISCKLWISISIDYRYKYKKNEGQIDIEKMLVANFNNMEITLNKKMLKIYFCIIHI